VRTLNLGILAHVDAGKTSLTERLLLATGVIDRLGRVDDGTTQTDTLDLERRRGITIRSAVVSFVVDDVTVNLIDTPGHPDFIAEVDRALGILDGAVLLVSAVEGVQAQTRLLMRALQRSAVPTLVFVNKIDRVGARPDEVVAAILDRLTPSVVPLSTTRGAGSPGAEVVALGRTDEAHVTQLVEVLAERDVALLEDHLTDARVGYERLRGGLAAQTARGWVNPVCFGSAITGAGIAELIDAIVSLLPATTGDVDAPLAGTVFKIERSAARERLAYVRLFAGTLHRRDRCRVGDREETVTAIDVFDGGTARSAPSAGAGQVATLHGLGAVQVGDPIGAPPPAAPEQHFAPPTLEAVVAPARPEDRSMLHAALVELAEQDPLIDLRLDDDRGDLVVSLYGEVQKEVLRDTLLAEYGVAVDFRETVIVCIERPAGVGHALRVRGRPGNPFQATVGIRIEPGPDGSGLAIRSEIPPGWIPPAYTVAVEETARASLLRGLSGWRVSDAIVTITDCDHRPPPVPVGGFRDLTPIVARAALEQAGTTVCEPIQRFEIELPSDTVAEVLSLLARLEASPDAHDVRGATTVLGGEVRTAHAPRLRQQLPGVTRGEGVAELFFGTYRPLGS
jgi:ribosomal protection tetracycline resistance protein